MMGQSGKFRGFSLIELLIVVSVLGILASLALLILGVQPHRAANEASAISTLRTLVTAERVYSLTHGNGTFGSLSDLRSVNMIDGVVAAGSKSGYSFTLSLDGESFSVVAVPETPRAGTRSFYTNQIGVITARAGGDGAGPEDTPIGN
jgi:type IV pilus assembly protein PilA